LKRLIVHADDLGADEARNAGIFATIEAGSVTAASILVNGPAFQDCIRRIAVLDGQRVSFGVHLNLTEGRPLCPGLVIITDADGCFYGKQEGHRRLMNPKDTALENEIRREFTAQIQALHATGVRIDHMDGHQHVHIFPAAIDAAVQVAREFGIPWMRMPEEPHASGDMAPDDRSLRNEAENFSRLAAAARIRIQGGAVKTTDHFRGLYLKGRLSGAHLEKTLQALPPGLTELMVHPGRTPSGPPQGLFSAFSNRDREEELDVLTHVSFRRMLEKYQVRLTPFPEVGL
jgi:predicted glycoside hydrolase/deacetylase ChbG (UPF0249 family)